MPFQADNNNKEDEENNLHPWIELLEKAFT
jgi:hypothetical protein